MARYEWLLGRDSNPRPIG